MNLHKIVNHKEELEVGHKTNPTK